MGRGEKELPRSFLEKRKILAANILRLREKAGLTQAELAAKAHFKRQPLLSEIENCSKAVNPTLETLCRLADALGVDVVKLLSPPRKN